MAGSAGAMRIAYGEIGATGAGTFGDGDLPHWRRRRAARTLGAHVDGGVAMTFGFFPLFGLVAMLALLAGGIALLPALFAIGFVVLALSLAFHVIGFVFRLLGFLLALLFAIPLALAAGGIVLAFGIALLHLALPLVVVAVVIWLIARHHRNPEALPRPN
jgi:hypothetical protein